MRLQVGLGPPVYCNRFLIIAAFALAAGTGAKAGSQPQPGKAQAPVSAATSATPSAASRAGVAFKPTVAAGTVNVATRKLDLDRLSLSDFGDLDQQTR